MTLTTTAAPTKPSLDAPGAVRSPAEELELCGAILSGMLGRGRHFPARWASRRFVREIDLVRTHLALISSRDTLVASFGRESHHRAAGERSGVDRVLRDLRDNAVQVAYAIRWLELGDGVGRPAWSELVARRPVSERG